MGSCGLRGISCLKCNENASPLESREDKVESLHASMSVSNNGNRKDSPAIVSPVLPPLVPCSEP